MHFNIVGAITIPASEFINYWGGLKGIVDDQALKLGGTISAEHGIGSIKRTRFENSAGAVDLKLMQNMKQAMDPDGRFNPDVLLLSRTRV